VDILVNPVDPSDAVITGGAANGWLVGTMFLWFGGLAEVLGILLVIGALG
jgi:hypothetical protein